MKNRPPFPSIAAVHSGTGRKVAASDALVIRRSDRLIYLMGGPLEPKENHQVRCNMLSRVTLDQLQMLIAVADAGNFSAAARKLNRVQSAVSQSIQSLEEALELSLGPSEQMGVYPQQRRIEHRLVEVTVVVDPAANVRVEHPGQVVQRLVASGLTARAAAS